MMIVLDANAGIEIALDLPRAERFRSVLESSEKVISSSLYKAEVANVIGKYVKAGRVPKASAGEKLELAQGLVDEFVDCSENNDESLNESIRIGHPVYDMLYLTLARRKGAALLTVDGKLKDICRNNGIEVVS